MSNENDYVERFTKYIPLLTFIALTYGTVTNLIEYSRFNINVISYLDVNEIVLQSIGDLVIVFCSALLIYFGMLIFIALGMGIGFEQSLQKPNTIASISANQPVMMLIKMNISIIIIGTILRYFNYVDVKLYTALISTVVLITTSLILFQELNRSYYQRHHKLITRELIFILSLSFFVLTYAIIKGISKNVMFHNDNKYLKNSIEFDGKLIKSTPTYYLILKTNNYVLFYNEANGTTDVFPTSKIDKYTLTR